MEHTHMTEKEFYDLPTLEEKEDWRKKQLEAVKDVDKAEYIKLLSYETPLIGRSEKNGIKTILILEREKPYMDGEVNVRVKFKEVFICGEGE